MGRVVIYGAGNDNGPERSHRNLLFGVVMLFRRNKSEVQWKFNVTLATCGKW
jgi:hypothetical protein